MEARDLVWGLLMGLSLAACAGLRAFVPLLVLGLAARFGVQGVHLPPDMAWLAAPPTLMAFACAGLLEVLADKFPALDHALDALGTLLRPLAGTVVVMAACPTQDPLARYVLGIVGGGGTATLFHAKKSVARAVSSVGTLGLANPLLSLLEDLGCAVGCIGALLAPLVAFVLCCIALVGGVWVVRRLARLLGVSKAQASSAA